MWMDYVVSGTIIFIVIWPMASCMNIMSVTVVRSLSTYMSHIRTSSSETNDHFGTSKNKSVRGK